MGQVTGELQDVREWMTYGNSAGNPTVSSTKAYTGTYSTRVDGDDKSIGVVFAAQSSLRAGYWLNHNGRITTQAVTQPVIWALRTVGTTTVKIVWTNASTLSLRVNDVEVATCPDTVISQTNQWMHIGLTYTTTRLILWVNGVSVFDHSGALLDAIIGVFAGGTNSNFGYGSYTYIDDFYVDGDIASVTEAPPPDRFLFSLPNGAGASSQWTPTGAASNYQCVDEAVPNDDTDYVKATDAGLLDLYAMADIALPTDYGVVSVIPIALAKTMAPGPTLKFVAADGVSANLESAEKTPGTSYAYAWESMPLAPDGGIWTEAKINAAQFGVKSAGVFA